MLNDFFKKKFALRISIRLSIKHTNLQQFCTNRNTFDLNSSINRYLYPSFGQFALVLSIEKIAKLKLIRRKGIIYFCLAR